MRSLGFEATNGGLPERFGGRRVRRARLQARSALPVSAACVVANGVRETLSSLFGAPVGMRLFEPCVPPPQAWPVILRDARCYRVRGKVADAAVVLRSGDAVALAATLFGESSADGISPRRLSPLEGDVLDRMVDAIVPNLGAVCGTRDGHSVERSGSIEGFVTYFELLVTEPVGARIGIALSRDPSPECGPALDVAHLAGIKLVAQASLDLGTADVAAVARLAVGDVFGVAPALLRRCTLRAFGRGLVLGSCGVRNGRYALAIEA